MLGIYNLIIEVVNFTLPVFGFLNNKLKKGIDGRRQTFRYLEQNFSKNDTVFWFHCASLGEYEQGLPVFERIKTKTPKAKILLSFFSPSGYEIRKDNPITPYVVYLPLDTRKNVRQFLELTHPKLVIFVKYDLWPNYLQALKNKAIHTVLISALFRPNQHFFGYFASSWRTLIFSFNHIFTQNKTSKKLLEDIGCRNVTLSKDTRFDRVTNQLNQDNSLPIIEHFLDGKKAIVAGSTWPEDNEIISPYINKDNRSLKFIIAPHDVSPKYINTLKDEFSDKGVLLSNYDMDIDNTKNILVIDCIGILSKLYSYASLAYIGGGMGTSGLHNTLEAAVFGIPIIIGKNYNKFPEAKEMIKMGGAVSVSSAEEFNSAIENFISNQNYREECGNKNKSYIDLNRGASDIIFEQLKPYI